MFCPVFFNRTIKIFTEFNTFALVFYWCEAFALFHSELTWIDVVTFLWNFICIANIISLILFASSRPWFNWIDWFSEETLLTVHSEKWFCCILWRILLLAFFVRWLCCAIFWNIAWNNFLSIFWDLILVACIILNPNHAIFGPWSNNHCWSLVHPEVADFGFVFNWEHGLWINFDVSSVHTFLWCLKWICFKIRIFTLCINPLLDILAVVIIWHGVVMCQFYNREFTALWSMSSTNSCNQYNHHNVNAFKHFFNKNNF